MRRNSTTLGCAAALALLAGCGHAPGKQPIPSITGGLAGVPSNDGPDAAGLSFTYRQHGSADETIDQTLQIENDFPYSVVPVLDFTPLDAHGAVLPHVHVGTVYGSDTGSLVAPFGYSLDILRFSGAGEHQVANVRVTVRRVSKARAQAGQYAAAQALDAHGQPVSKFSRFSAVAVTNPNPFPVSVRIVYVVYDQPASGQTQQVVLATPIGGLASVPANGKATVQVTATAAQAIAENADGPAVSIKTYPSQ